MGDNADDGDEKYMLVMEQVGVSFVKPTSSITNRYEFKL